jgi:hypothetical protein
MESRPNPSFKNYLPAFLILFLGGWVGVGWLVLFTLPAVWQRWSFFLFLILALTGSALPVTYYLNLRFPSKPPVTESIIVRQSLWLGIYGSILTWLQLGGVAQSWTIIILGIGLIIIEYLIRLRERSRWQPPAQTDEVTPINPEG